MTTKLTQLKQDFTEGLSQISRFLGVSQRHGSDLRRAVSFSPSAFAG